MIELERHIETLLLSSDCVVVPDFGGFVAHHIEAHYDETDGTFIPPRRTLGFNPKLKINDSLLVHSYIEAYDLSYPEALSRIEEEVSQLREQLETQGSYELHGIGMLTVNTEGNIDFTPCEAGVLTPELYGLSTFEIKPLVAEHIEQLPLPEEKTKPVAPVLSIDESHDDEEEAKTISIRVAWLRNAVAVAAAVLAFFLITTPVSNSIDPNTSMSSISLSAIADSPSLATVVPSIPAVNAHSSNIKTQSPTPSYVIVLASHVARANADTFVEQLHRQGYTEARVIERKGIVCVVYGSYATQGEAYQSALKLHSNKELEQAWVMEL